jgi:reactive intermediate/imine deaminase
MVVQRVNAPGVVRLPAFCHASVVGDQVLVSGTLGTRPDALELVDGGVKPETIQALTNLGTILDACGCSFADIAKINVYVTDMSTFGDMNEAYLSFFGDAPPARITIGCAGLALGAAVELDCVAFRQTS